MAYSQEDLDAIRDAEVKRAEGRMPESITINGRTIQYARMGAQERRALKAEIIRSLNKRRPRAYAAYSRKGI